MTEVVFSTELSNDKRETGMSRDAFLVYCRLSQEGCGEQAMVVRYERSPGTLTRCGAEDDDKFFARIVKRAAALVQASQRRMIFDGKLRRGV